MRDVVITMVAILASGIAILFIGWIVIAGEIYGTWSRIRGYWRQYGQRQQTTPNLPHESFHLPIQTPPMDPLPTYPPLALIRPSPRPPTKPFREHYDTWV